MEVWDEIVDGYLELDSSAWLGTPMDTNKFLLVSWRMGGSEFTKELIRENFPETININHWAKSHIILNNDISEKLVELGTKVFVVISDPREVALNLVYFDRGMHIGTYDYEMWRYNNITNSKEFFNEVADKQIGGNTVRLDCISRRDLRFRKNYTRDGILGQGSKRWRSLRSFYRNRTIGKTTGKHSPVWFL